MPVSRGLAISFSEFGRAAEKEIAAAARERDEDRNLESATWTENVFLLQMSGVVPSQFLPAGEAVYRP